MDENYWNKIILYAIYAILAYIILQMIVKYLIYGVIGLVVWRLILLYDKNK